MQWAIAVATLIAAGGIGLATLPGLMQRSLYHYQQAACIKLGNFPVASTAFYDALGAYDYGCFTTGWWENGPLQSLTQEVHKRNPRFNAGSYLTVFAVAEWEASASPTSINGDWYRTMLPFIAYTTEQDTAVIYPRARVVNYMLPGAIEAAAGVWRRHLNTPEAQQVKWVMLDFCSSPLPDMMGGSPLLAAQQHGRMDLDGDGLDHWHDVDEQARWREINFELMDILRETRPGLKLIPNGQLAIVDPAFARLVDGCYIEGFPQWFFGGDWNYVNALSTTYPHGIPALTRPGRFRSDPAYIMVEDRYDQGIVGRIAGLYDSVIEMRRSSDDRAAPRAPVDLRALGAPKAAAYVNGGITSRAFEKGVLSVTVTGPRQATYQVEQR
jgi:hypothetical protein